jgi:phosphoribosylcarboxyaminoimidazole (NCAIR) mutase
VKVPVGAQVAIIMGSQSDWETMKNAAAVLEKLGVATNLHRFRPSHA